MALDVLTLNGVSLSDETSYALEALNGIEAAPKIEEWVEPADNDGQTLVRVPRYANRVFTAEIRITKQSTQNAMLEKIDGLVELFQEAEKNPTGVPLKYSPAGSSKEYTLYCLTGKITEVPMVIEGAGVGFYNAFSALVKVQITCRPFGYGSEEEVLTAKANETGLSTAIRALPEIKGDVPAEGRLVVKDTAKVGRRFVEFGLENRYNTSQLLVEAPENTSTTLVAVGGALSELTGAYKAGAGTKTTIATTLVSEPTVCCETGVLKHVGQYRVKCRGQVVLGSESVAENVHVRLSWQDGEGQFRANEYDAPVVGGKFVELDLGPVTITEAKTGSQKWVGKIEAYSANSAAVDVFHVNYLTFIPTEVYGKAVGPALSSGGTVAAYDNFESYSAASALNTKTPPVGAAWATSGAATDWEVVEVATVGTGTNKVVQRKTKSDAEPRFGVLGGSIGASAIRGVIDMKDKPTGGEIVQGLILRWTNSSNYAFALVRRRKGGGPSGNFAYQMGTVVAGTTTTLAESSATGPVSGEAFTEWSFTATLDGALTMKVYNGGPTLSGSSTAIATGGALASGKAGIYDRNTGTTEIGRWFDVISVVTLPGIPYVIQSEKTCEFRSDSTLTFDSTGTYAGPSPVQRGGRFYLPQAGQEKRVSRLLVKADRNNLEEADQQTIADAFTIQVFATPRYLGLPR